MDFDTFDTYSEEIADEGIWVPVRRSNRTLIEVKLRYVDGLTQSGELEYKRARAPFAKLIKVGALDDFELAVIALCYVNIRDWKGVTAGGKPVDFTPQVAREFFKADRNRWMALELLKVANDPENFQADEEFDADEAIKN